MNSKRFCFQIRRQRGHRRHHPRPLPEHPGPQGAGRPLHGGHRQDLHHTRCRPGDIMVGGWNFGCGSSREHAPHGHQGRPASPASSPRALPASSTATPSTSACPFWSARGRQRRPSSRATRCSVDFDTGVITDETTGRDLSGRALPALHPEDHRDRRPDELAAEK